MNPLYELVPVTEKATENGWYVLYGSPTIVSEAFYYRDGYWRSTADENAAILMESDLQCYKGYFRHYTPAASKSVEEMANVYALQYDDKTKCAIAEESFLAGYSAGEAEARTEIDQLKKRLAALANEYNDLLDQSMIWKEESGN